MSIEKIVTAAAPRIDEASEATEPSRRCTFDSLGDFVGHTCMSSWITVDQMMIDQFARTTHDEQWVHVDVERCKRESPFGAPVAHGFLTLSLLAPLLIQSGVIPEDATQAINCGVDQARFLAPVLAGDRVRTHIELLSAERKSADRTLICTRHVLEIEGRDKPALTANLVVMVYR